MAAPAIRLILMPPRVWGSGEKKKDQQRQAGWENQRWAPWLFPEHPRTVGQCQKI